MFRRCVDTIHWTDEKSKEMRAMERNKAVFDQDGFMYSCKGSSTITERIEMDKQQNKSPYYQNHTDTTNFVDQNISSNLQASHGRK